MIRNARSFSAEADDPRMKLAFPALSPTEIEVLEGYGTRMCIPEGGTVWTAGDANLAMFVVAKGSLRIVDGRTQAFIACHPEGHFSGDIDVLSGRPAIVSGVADESLEVIKVPADCVRNIVGEHPTLGEVILRAFLLRRNILQEAGGFGPLIVGSRYSPDTLRIREFLSRNRFPFSWEDLEDNPGTSSILEEFHVSPDQTPVVILPNGDLLRVPSNLELGESLGVSRPIEGEVFDLVIIGAGPAGLAAGVYGASEGLTTLIVDAGGPGGQAGTSARIENYMGFPNGVSGQELADRAVAQVERFGAQLLVPAKVKNVTCNELGSHGVELDDGRSIEAKCVLLATGASYRKLDADNFEQFEGRGIYYACTNVERILCHQSTVAVVGAGNSAGQAAVFLAEATEHVYLVVRGDDLRKTMSSYLALRIEQSPKITVLLNSEICELGGEGFLQSATVVNRSDKSSQELKLSGVFVMIGAVPHTSWLPASIAQDKSGFVLTGTQAAERAEWKLTRQPFYLESTCPGVFAAGDARASSVKRVASAVGEGSMAVAFVHQYLALS